MQLCGGGPQLSLWHLKTLNVSNVFPIECKGIHVAQFHEKYLLGGGKAQFLYNVDINGEIISKIPVSSPIVYSIVLKNEPRKMLCIAGSSSKIDICTNFNYRDQVLKIL